MTPIEIISKDIDNELQRAEELHPDFPTDPIHMVAIMAEESGEAVRAANQFYDGEGTLDELREELVQTATMCVRCLLRLGEYECHS